MTTQENLTKGYDVLYTQVKRHMTSNEIYVLDIVATKKRGKKKYIFSCQCEQATGKILNYVRV
tara:strand:+ start:309 stop:497 length:189 start_codon:yes stop_codon:yes gene_type:complete